MNDYTRRIGTVLDSIQNLLEVQPQLVMELCEYGISLLDTAMNSIDDSSGDMGTLLEEFQKLHYDACDRAQPDVIALAERLFQAEMTSHFGSFYKASETYAPILGDAGFPLSPTSRSRVVSNPSPRNPGRKAQAAIARI